MNFYRAAEIAIAGAVSYGFGRFESPWLAAYTIGIFTFVYAALDMRGSGSK